MNRKIALVLIYLLTVMLLAGCGKEDVADGRVIAEVGEASIIKTQLDNQIAYLRAIYEDQLGMKLDEVADADILDRLKEQAYSNLLMEEMVLQDAAKQDIKADQASIDTSVNQLKTYLQNQNISYANFLKQYNLSESDYLRKLEIDNIMNQLHGKVTAGITITPEEERDYYDANVSTLFTQEAGIQISHILVTDEAVAKALIDQLNNGADFAVLARDNSLDGSAAQGGDLGSVNEGTNFVPEFKSAALALQPGEYTKEPVQSQFGYHIIKAGDRTPATIMPYEEVEPQIQSQLLNEKKNAAFEAYLSKLEETIGIVDKREASDRGTQLENSSSQQDTDESTDPSTPK